MSNMNISTDRGYGGESAQQKEGYINLIYDRETEGEEGDKKGRLLQKVCINKDTTCSTAQGKDELSRIKKERKRGEKDGKVKGYSVHLYKDFFLQRLVVEILRIGNRNREQDGRTDTGKPKHTYNHPGSRKTQDETETEREVRRYETIGSYSEDRGSQWPRDTRRWAVCIHVRCDGVWSWDRKSETRECARVMVASFVKNVEKGKKRVGKNPSNKSARKLRGKKKHQPRAVN